MMLSNNCLTFNSSAHFMSCPNWTWSLAAEMSFISIEEAITGIISLAENSPTSRCKEMNLTPKLNILSKERHNM